MKVTIIANKIIVTSTLKVDDIALLKKYKPEALEIKDANGNEVFKIGYVEGKPSIAPFGVTFGTKSLDGNGFAQVAVDCDANVNNVKENAADKVAPVQKYLETLEATIPSVVVEINKARSDLMNTMVVG